MKIHYNPKLKQRARDLRNNSTLAEVLLWNQLKGRKLRNYQFMRQKSIGEYIVDFFCSKLKFVIEIDGNSHQDKYAYDMKRQRYLESIGLYVLRFNDLEVKNDMPNVLSAIEGYVVEFEDTTP